MEVINLSDSIYHPLLKINKTKIVNNNKYETGSILIEDFNKYCRYQNNDLIFIYFINE